MRLVVALIVLPAMAAGLLVALRLLDLDDSYVGALLAFGALSVLTTLLFALVRRRPARAVEPPSAEPPSAEPPTAAPPAVAPPGAATAAVDAPPVAPVAPPSLPPPPGAGAAAKALAPLAAGGRAAPPPGPPRGYMGEANGAPPVHDYMRRRLTEPREPIDVPQRGPVAQPPRRERRASGAPPEHGRAAAPAGEFIPFAAPAAPAARAAERGASPAGASAPAAPAAPAASAPAAAARAAERGASPARASAPAVEARPPAPPVVAERPAGALRPRTVTPSVDLGSASRALQRRLPSALAYYRREGVATAVWAGVATSVLVTAVAWRARRGGRSGA